jgi:tetratricopeptide (TPR) repeat protein
MTNRSLPTARVLLFSLAASSVLLPALGCNRAARKGDASRTAPVSKSAAAPAPQLLPSEADASYTRGKLLASQGLDDIALAEFTRAIDVNPTFVPAYMGMGEIHQKRGDFGQAQKSYEAAANIAPSNFDAQYNNGLMLQLLNRLADSVRAYLRALQVRPDDFNANLNLATAYFQLGEPQPALPYAQKAVQLKGDNGPARVNLGAIYAALNQHDLAVIEYQQAAELIELSPELLLNLADSLGKVRRFEEMQNALEQLIRTKPTPVAYERLATAFFRQQKFELSLTNFRKAIELDPDYYPALNGVGVCLLNRYLTSERKDLEAREEAVRVLRRSLQIERKQPAVLDLLNKYG